MKDQERKRTKPFAGWLQEQRRGELHNELSDALADVVQAVQAHGKGGELTLKVKIAPAGDQMVAVTDDVTCKLPKANRPHAMFFTDDEGNVSRRDPRQQELGPLEAVQQPRDTDDAGQQAQEA